MITLRSWYIFLIAALWFANLSWAGLTQELKPEAVAPGQRAILTIRLDQADLEGVDLADDANVPELNEEPLSKADGMPMLERNYERTKSQFIWKFAFTAYLPGTYQIPPVEIRFGPQTFSSTAQTLTVHTFRPDGDEELRPEFPEESVPTEFSWGWVKWAVLLVLIAAAYFAFKQLQKKSKRTGEPSDFEAPELWLRAQLEKLLADSATLPPVTIVENYSSILREYLRKRYLAPTHAMTLRELTRTVQSWEKWDEPTQPNPIARLMNQMEIVLFRSQDPAGDFPRDAVQTTQDIWLKDKPRETP